MLTPTYLYSVSDEAAALYSELSYEILDDIARRIVKTGYITDTADYQLYKAKQMGFVSKDTIKYLSQVTNKSEKEIKKLMKEAGVEALAYDDSVYKAAGKTPLALSSSPAMKAIILQGADDTMTVIGNYTKSLAAVSQKAVENSIDRVYLQIMSGAFSRNTAIRTAINDLAENGYENIAYPSGNVQRVESVVRRAITTSVNQSAAKLTLARMDDMNCDLVEVSSHAGARPSHAEWQGRVYSRSGKKRKYKDFVTATGYGNGDGLCGWNCYHSFYPYFEGLSTRSFSEDPAKDAGKNNDEMYEQSQKQRRYESEVRKSKQKCITYNAAAQAADGELKDQLTKDFERESVKLQAKKKKLDDFVKSTGGKRLTEREQVAGWNHSISSKASYAAKRAS